MSNFPQDIGRRDGSPITIEQFTKVTISNSYLTVIFLPKNQKVDTSYVKVPSSNKPKQINITFVGEVSQLMDLEAVQVLRQQFSLSSQ